jgi:hypothetical protein
MNGKSETARRRYLERLADQGRFAGAELGTERIDDVRDLRQGDRRRRRRRRKYRSWADEYVAGLMGQGDEKGRP